MAKLDPIVPIVPSYATAGLGGFCWHLWLAVLHLVGLGPADKHKGSLRRGEKGEMVLGQSCRGLFAVLWSNFVAPDARVLVSPYHHHSFKRMMTATGQKLDACSLEGHTLSPPKGKTGKDYDAIVVTHLLGRDYEWAWVRDWRKQNPNLLVIEDRVQGGYITEEDSTLADVTLYSCGQDKVPNYMGGGFAKVHDSKAELREKLAALMEALPMETEWARFVFLVKKIPTVLVYNVRFFCIAFAFVAGLFGLSRNRLTDSYRKKNPGFMHGGYMIRPSNALIHSMSDVENISRWLPVQQGCVAAYRSFIHMLPADLQGKVAPLGVESACTYFFICLPSYDNFDASRELLAQRGFITISNQTYLSIKDADQPRIDPWITAPYMPALTPAELKKLVETVKELWATDGVGHGKH